MSRAGTRRALVMRGTSATTNWWDVAGKTCVAVYQPKGAASLGASYINLANPGTYNAIPNVAPSLDADGWVFSNSANFNSQIPVPDLTAQAWSAFVRFSGANKSGDGMNSLFGYTANSSPWDGFQVSSKGYSSGDPAVASFGRGISVSDAQLAAGIIGIAGNTGYLDGTPKGTMAAGTTNPDSEFRIVLGGVSNNSATVAEGWSRFIGKIQAIVFYSSVLTESEAVALTSRMAAL